MKFLKQMITFLLVLFLLSHSISSASAANLSQGVYHSTESKTISGYPQKINKISINLEKPFTTIDAGISSPISTLRTVSSLSKIHTQANHHVVGAINASFFDFGTKNPSYLITQNNDIKHLGSVSTNYNDFMYTPAAFGLTANNKAKIGTYNLSFSIEHNGSASLLTGLNRERAANESILFTSSYAYSHTRTNATGLEVIVTTPKSVDQQSKLGEKLTGKVTGIRSYGDATSAEIPKNGFVISAVGTAEVDKIRNMKIGDDVSLTIDVDQDWKNSKFMLASGPLLVQNGKSNLSIDLNSPRVRERTSRTAVATDSTGNNAYFVTVDGRQSGYSQGLTLVEFANYLVSIGVYNALNLDGGGSTAMVTRKYGDVYPTLVNRPSDGTERSVSAILEAVSTAPYGDPTHINATQSENGILAVGATVGYKVNSVLDQYYNVLAVDQSKLILQSVSNGIGKIENNKVVGLKAGVGSVVAKYGPTTITFPLTVTDTISQLVATPTEIRLGTNEATTIKVKGISNNQQVIFNPAAVNWTTSGSIGSINGTTFTSGNSQTSGAIVGTYGSAKVNIPVVISTAPLALDPFESTSGLTAEAIRGTASLSTEKVLQPKNIAASVKLSYDFTAYKEGTSAAYMTWNSSISIPAQPKRIGVWVYGDGANHWLRGSLTDATGKEVIVDFTEEDGLNWTGWKYVEANIPTTTVAPMKLNKIYLAELTSTQKNKGAIWFDQLQAAYHSGNTNEKAFTPDSSARLVPNNKQFTVTFNQTMNTNTFTSKNVYVEDIYGNRQNVTVAKGSDDTKLVVTAPLSGYESGKNYRLVVTHYVPNAKGIKMKKDSLTEFKVQ